MSTVFIRLYTYRWLTFLQVNRTDEEKNESYIVHTEWERENEGKKNHCEKKRNDTHNWSVNNHMKKKNNTQEGHFRSLTHTYLFLLLHWSIGNDECRVYVYNGWKKVV